MILLFHSVLPPPLGIRGGNDFCVISQAGGATANRGGGEDDFRQSSWGGTALS